VTSAKEAKLRGNRMLTGSVDSGGKWVGEWTKADQDKLAIQAGAGLTFTGAGTPTKISSGDVCGYYAITGLAGNEYVLSQASSQVFSSGCNADAAVGGTSLFDLHTTAVSVADPLPALQLGLGEMGGLTFQPGTYRSTTLTVAAGATVTLDGNGKFLFLSSSTFVTGAAAKFELTGGALAEDVVFVTVAAANIGAASKLQGSVVAGAAITLGAASEVVGGVFALAAITIGASCDFKANIANVYSSVEALINGELVVGPDQPTLT